MGIFALKDEVKELHAYFGTENNSSKMLVEPSSALPQLIVNYLLHKLIKSDCCICHSFSSPKTFI